MLWLTASAGNDKRLVTKEPSQVRGLPTMHELARLVIRTLTINAEAVSTQEAYCCASCELPTPLQRVEDALKRLFLTIRDFPVRPRQRLLTVGKGSHLHNSAIPH